MEDPLKNQRRLLRIWLDDRRLAREEKYYAQQFAKRRLIIPDDAAIRQHTADRFPHLKPLPKGRLRILTIHHNYNWENTALIPALAKFGTVHHYDWMTSFQNHLSQWQRSLTREMNEDLLRWISSLAAENRIDVIFTYLSGEQITQETMTALQAQNIPMVNLALNDKENFVGKIRSGRAMGVRDICRYFTLCWTSTEDALKKYCVEGALPLYLPEGANPDLHKPANTEQTIDVSFIGQRYGNREEIIRKLQTDGIQVQAYGFGWQNGPLTTDAMVEMYSKSRINLGFGGVIGHRGTYCLKGRDFEIPMSGGLYLTEHHAELVKAYEIGREIVTYRGYEDLLSKIRDLLDHPDKAREIRRQGFERARREHAWEMRFEKIFNILGLIP